MQTEVCINIKIQFYRKKIFIRNTFIYPVLEKYSYIIGILFAFNLLFVVFLKMFTLKKIVTLVSVVSSANPKQLCKSYYWKMWHKQLSQTNNKTNIY